jgi:ribosome assembly protein YihI (activator of Der GTPase)
MKREDIIQLFLDAEEELRNGNEDKCLELKAQFQEELKKLSKEDEQYVREYLEDLGA